MIKNPSSKPQKRIWVREYLLQKYKTITADSRKVKKNSLFFALPRTHAEGKDGIAFIPDAINHGASGILCLNAREAKKIIGQTIKGSQLDMEDIEVISSDNPRRELSLLLATQLGMENLPAMTLITGTNGKSSIAQMIREISASTEQPVASVGTLGIFISDGGGSRKWQGSSLTTPDPEWLYPALSKLKKQGIRKMVMEASSHGLDQYRLHGLRGVVNVAGMAELSQDHLDYHLDLASYYESKLKLFTEILSSGGRMVYWQHCPIKEKLDNIAHERQMIPVTLSRTPDNHATLSIATITPAATKQIIDFIFMGKPYQVTIPLLGLFQAENALTALMMSLPELTHRSLQSFLTRMSNLSPIRGRMERVDSHQHPAYFFIDYAHTASALETALTTLRPFTKGRLIVVFGCGGDRQKEKRPAMGAVADSHADIAIITDDNPRSEDPKKIRKSILANCPKGMEADDRRSAIQTAVGLAKENDIVLVAGKGHEVGQTIGETTLPFDDKIVIEQEIKKFIQQQKKAGVNKNEKYLAR